MLVQEVVRNASGTELVRNRVVTGSGNVLAFSFDESAELVEGKWTFEVFLGTEILASQDFDVAKEHSLPSSGSDGFIKSFCDTEIRTGSNLPLKTCAPVLVSK
jgi:hypothetical protein